MLYLEHYLSEHDMNYKASFMHIVCVVVVLMSANLWGEVADIEKQPVLPEPLVDNETIEPDINIIQKDDRTVEEYRHGGQLYMIKVTPKIGAPYYFIDTDGDGSLESHQYELSGHIVPNWILLQW